MAIFCAMGSFFLSLGAIDEITRKPALELPDFLLPFLAIAVLFGGVYYTFARIAVYEDRLLMWLFAIGDRRFVCREARFSALTSVSVSFDWRGFYDVLLTVSDGTKLGFLRSYGRRQLHRLLTEISSRVAEDVIANDTKNWVTKHRRWNK